MRMIQGGFDHFEKLSQLSVEWLILPLSNKGKIYNGNRKGDFGKYETFMFTAS